MMSNLERIAKDNKELMGNKTEMFGRVVQTYTEDFRTKVVEYSHTHTTEETSIKFNVPHGTVGTWRAREKRDRLNTVGPRKNHPNSKPSGPREVTTSIPERELSEKQISNQPLKRFITDDMSAAEIELAKVAENLWQELIVIEEALKLLKTYRNKR